MFSCSTTSTCVGRAPPLRLLVSTNDFSSYPLICYVPVFVPMKLASYRCIQSSVCVTTMRLPFERVAFINMHVFCIFITVILSNCPPYPWTARVCVDWVRFPICSAPDPMQNFVSASLLFSGYTSSLLIAETCIRRTAGRCCRNFASDPEQSMGKRTQSTHTGVGLGPIFTY